jgi:2-methylisocitrate lyase-like PEP mutase family enzyme
MMRAGRRVWKQLLDEHKPLLLPAAHDALTAKIIEQAGFPAYQIGGFALDASRYGLPDIDLSHMKERSIGVEDIIRACELPVLVDIDDGYGDVKNVTFTVREYESIGATAVFIEDQKAPKRCGHMTGKQVIPQRVMEEKVQAAVAARQDNDPVYIIARTDAIAALGLRDAIKRGEAYLKAGADAIYLEGPTSVKQVEEISAAFRGVHKVITLLEGGGQTPWLPPEQLAKLGFSMVLYPTSILFRMAHTIQQAVMDIKHGRPMDQKQALNMDSMEEVLGMKFWQHIEQQYQYSHEDYLGLRQWLKGLIKKKAA